ncbi:MAG: type 2 isopentenyl-diphosphate Delta-isomerase [Thermoplasmatota archaeon]
MLEKRKNDHIEICLNREVSANYNYWDDIILLHQAFPSTDHADIELDCDILGKKLSAPLILSGMTGGSKRAGEFNLLLARAASEFGIGFGVGSQRAGLEEKSLRSSYKVVKEFDIPLVLGNIGVPQLSNLNADGSRNENIYGVEKFREAAAMVDADAVCLHLNYLQEVVQPEGETRVTGVIENLREVCGEIQIVGKETGAGISREAARILISTGVKAIDVGGLSGTSFSAVESYRGNEEDAFDIPRRLGKTFWDWGIPTPVSVRLTASDIPVIATGGLRNGLDIARSMALGASCGGMAYHLLRAASKGYDYLKNEIDMILMELRAAVFLSGVSRSSELHGIDPIIIGRTKDILDQLK